MGERERERGKEGLVGEGMQREGKAKKAGIMDGKKEICRERDSLWKERVIEGKDKEMERKREEGGGKT